MTGKEIRRFLPAQPFLPLTVFTTQKKYRVRYRQLIWIHPKDSMLIIAPETDEGLDMLQLPLIERIEVDNEISE